MSIQGERLQIDTSAYEWRKALEAAQTYHAARRAAAEASDKLAKTVADVIDYNLQNYGSTGTHLLSEVLRMDRPGIYRMEKKGRTLRD